MKRLKDMRKSGNIMYLTFYDDHTKTDIEKIFILRNDVVINGKDDLYEYDYDDEIESGEFALFLVIDEKYASWNEKKNALNKHALLFFVGDDERKIKNNLTPYFANAKKVDMDLKIIDFYISGNQMKLYLGEPSENNYWGDDWDDAPYEHNAGTVYSDFVKDIVVVNFLGDELVEICEKYTNSPFSKEDFKNGAPFAYIENENEEYSMHQIRRNNIFDNNNIRKFYFNTPIIDIYNMGYLITD